MSIATQIENLTAKVSTLSDVHDDIITAINSKGVQATGHGFEDFADDIEAISQSGTHSPVISVADTGVVSASCGGVTNTHTLSASDDADFVAGNIKLGVTVFGVTGTHQGAGTYESKTVTPNAAGQTVYPDSGYDALSSVVINGDADLVAGNIKKDVDIFGVTGTFEGGSLETKTVTPSASTQTITPSSGHYGLSSVTVNSAPLETKTVTPSASAQTVTPSSGNYGLGSVTVNGDADLIASNIRKDTEIFGVTGTMEEKETYQVKTVTPNAAGQTVTPDSGYGALSSVVVNGDADFVASNIKKDVDIFGVTGTYGGELESKTVTPSASSQTVTPSSGKFALSSVIVNGDIDLIASNIRNNIEIFGVTGTYDTNSAVPGSLIVCTCSSDITSVIATYGSVSLTAYMSNNVAYVVIPYTYTGAVYLDGYIDSFVAASNNITITTINKYECSLSTAKVIYDSGTWASFVGSHTWRSYEVSSVTENASSLSVVCKPSDGSYLYPVCMTAAISNPGYTKIRVTGYCNSSVSSSFYFAVVDTIPNRPYYGQYSVIGMKAINSITESTYDVNMTGESRPTPPSTLYLEFYYPWIDDTNKSGVVTKIEFI